jgi:pyruvate dehydrogenase E1 component beta subunit
VVAPNTLANPKQLLIRAISEDDDPVLFIEHKLLYGCRLLSVDTLESFNVEFLGSYYPAAVLSIKGAPKGEITFACYGHIFELVREGMLQLMMEYEIPSEVVVFSQISPLDTRPLLDSVRRTHRLITVEEANPEAGWGSEAISATVEKISSARVKYVGRVGARSLPIASSQILERKFLPSVEDIVATGSDAIK